MSYKLEIKLLGLPKGLNGSHGSWRVAAARRKFWRLASCKQAMFKKPKTGPLEKCEIVCTRFSGRKMDYDNLVSSFKPIIDGLKDAGIIADDSSDVIVRRIYMTGYARAKEGFVTVLVTEIE